MSQQVRVCIWTQNDRTRPNIQFAPLSGIAPACIQTKNTVVKHDEIVHLLPFEYISLHSSKHITNRSDLFNFLLLLVSQSFELCSASLTPFPTLAGHVSRIAPTPIAQELADDDIVPGLDDNGEPERTGETWAEEQIEAIPVGERKGKSYEQLLGRLTQYLRSGQEQDAALDRLKRSLSDAPINAGELAVLGKDS
eukprot:COSAG02_NODE_417_length_22746_cov_9.074172_2_plen_195_part_00